MEINDVQLQKIQQIYQNKNEKPEKKDDSRKDRMNISARAQEIVGLKEELGEVSEVRQEKVEALKNSIKNGKYDVDSKKIARKILNRLE